MTVDETKVQNNTAQTVRQLIFDVEPTLFSTQTRGDRSFQELKILYIQAKKQYMDIINKNIFDQQEYEYSDENKLRIDSLWDSLLTHLLEGLTETQMLCDIANGKASAKQKGVFRKKKEEEYVNGKFQNSKKDYQLCLAEGKDILKLAGVQEKVSQKIRSSTQTISSVSDDNSENSEQREVKQKNKNQQPQKVQNQNKQFIGNDQKAMRKNTEFQGGSMKDIEIQQSKSKKNQKQDRKQSLELQQQQQNKDKGKANNSRSNQKQQNKIKVNKFAEDQRIPGDRNRKQLEIIKEVSIDADNSNTKYSYDGDTPGSVSNSDNRKGGLFTKQRSGRSPSQSLGMQQSPSNKLSSIQQSDQDGEVSQSEFGNQQNSKKKFNFLKRPSPSSKLMTQSGGAKSQGILDSQDMENTQRSLYTQEASQSQQNDPDEIGQQLQQKNRQSWNIIPDKYKAPKGSFSTQQQIKNSANDVVTKRKDPIDTINHEKDALKSRYWQENPVNTSQNKKEQANQGGFNAKKSNTINTIFKRDSANGQNKGTSSNRQLNTQDILQGEDQNQENVDNSNHQKSKSFNFKDTVRSSIKHGESLGLNIRNGFKSINLGHDSVGNRNLQTDSQDNRISQSYSESPTKGSLSKIMTQGRKMNNGISSFVNQKFQSKGMTQDEPLSAQNEYQSAEKQGSQGSVQRKKSNFLQEFQERKLSQQCDDIDSQLMNQTFDKDSEINYEVQERKDNQQGEPKSAQDLQAKKKLESNQSDKGKFMHNTATSYDLNTDKFISGSDDEELPARAGEGEEASPEVSRQESAGNSKSVRLNEANEDENVKAKPTFAISGNTSAWNNITQVKNGSIQYKNGETGGANNARQDSSQDLPQEVNRKSSENATPRNGEQGVMPRQSSQDINQFFSTVFRDLDSNQDERILNALNQLQARCVDRPESACKRALIKMGVLKKLVRTSMLAYPNVKVQQHNVEFLSNLVKSDFDIKKYVIDTVKDQQIRQLLTVKNDDQLNTNLAFLLQLALPSSKNWQLSMMFANQVQLKSFTLIHTITCQNKQPQIVSKSSRMISCILPIKKVFQQEILQEAVLSNFVTVLEKWDSSDVVKNICQSLGYAFHNPQNRLMIEILNGYKPFVLSRFVKSVIIVLDKFRDKPEHSNIRATIAYLLTGIAVALPDLKSDILNYQGMQLMLNLAAKSKEKESSLQALKCIAVCIKGETEVQESFIQLNGINFMSKILQNSQEKRSTFEEFRAQVQQIVAFMQGIPMVQTQMNESGLYQYLQPNQPQPQIQQPQYR